MIISKSRWNKIPDRNKKILDDKKYIFINYLDHWQEVTLGKVDISPTYGDFVSNSPWEGFLEKKPWDYDVTAVIPCLNTFETLKIAIELLRLQSVKPFIMVIDTGSTEEQIKEIFELRDIDLEVHSIALNGVRHPSDYPAMAMDLAFTLCRSKYLFATHADCFLRKQTFLKELMDLCKIKSPVVGYQISPRAHEDWVGMVSHTASMYDVKKMDQINFSWSLRKLCNRYDISNYKPDPMSPNWPDTEILGNYILRENKIIPYLIGKEENKTRTLDDNIDHFRSYTSAKLYSPEYFATTKLWFEDAKQQAEKRISKWRMNYLLPSKSVFA